MRLSDTTAKEPDLTRPRGWIASWPSASRFGWLPLLRLYRDRRGVTALELGLIAAPVLIFLLGTMETAYDLFVQVTLDRVAESAARAVQVGSATGTAGEKSAAFVTNTVCPAVGGLLNCNNLVVAVAPIATGSDYYTNPNPLSITSAGSAAGSICTGTAGRLMLIQLWYLGPSFVGGLIPGFTTSYAGSTYHITSATAGFVNEATITGQASGVGC